MRDENAEKAKGAMQRARFQIITDRRLTFFGVVTMNLTLVPARWLPTAAVDGRHMFFNPEFILGLTPEQVKGVVCHEVGHVVGFHFERENGREHDKWNIATDIKINRGLKGMGIDLPAEAKYGNHTHDPMTCEEVYRTLPPQPSNSKGGKGDGFTVTDIGGCGTMISPRDKDGNPLTQAEARQVEHEQRAFVEEATRMAKAQGALPQFIERMISDAYNKPLPWQEILKRFVDRHVKRDWTWTRPARRMLGQGVYLPSQRVEGVGEVVIGIDTSGSISQQILSMFNKEVQTIMNDASPARIHIMYCDAAVHRVDTFERGDEIVMKAVGGGGTNFSPVFHKVSELGIDPLCLIYFTDLMGSFPPEPEYPVIWGATTDLSPPFGETFRIESVQ